MDFLCDCFKNTNNNEGNKTKRKFCPWWKRNRETLLYTATNNTNIELSNESLNINIPQPDNRKNYDTCSSAIYAESFENERNQKVIFNLLYYLFLQKKPSIEMKNLSRKFGKLFAVDEVSLQLYSDQIFWYI